VQLTYLSLWDNQLSGTIPSTIGNLEQLTFLDLSENRLTGPIPSTFGNLLRLTRLDVYDNDLSGSIPPALCFFLSVTEEIYIDCFEISCTCCEDFYSGSSCPST
jgi:Leucine-rich repeat (LRR) protein